MSGKVTKRWGHPSSQEEGCSCGLPSPFQLWKPEDGPDAIPADWLQLTVPLLPAASPQKTRLPQVLSCSLLPLSLYSPSSGFICSL